MRKQRPERECVGPRKYLRTPRWVVVLLPSSSRHIVSRYGVARVRSILAANAFVAEGGIAIAIPSQIELEASSDPVLWFTIDPTLIDVTNAG